MLDTYGDGHSRCQIQDSPGSVGHLLMVAAVGFVPHHDGGLLQGVWGGLIGFGVMLVTALLGRIIYKKRSLGGGDIKLFGALGLCPGADGILSVFILSTFLSAFHMGFLMIKKRITPESSGL